MTGPDPLARTTLSVSEKAHKAVQAMQGKLKEKLGYRVTQSETVIRGMEALEEKMEAGEGESDQSRIHCRRIPDASRASPG